MKGKGVAVLPKEYPVRIQDSASILESPETTQFGEDRVGSRKVSEGARREGSVERLGIPEVKGRRTYGG